MSHGEHSGELRQGVHGENLDLQDGQAVVHGTKIKVGNQKKKHYVYIYMCVIIDVCKCTFWLAFDYSQETSSLGTLDMKQPTCKTHGLEPFNMIRS